MSFILDALRKSESERQRNQQPGMVTSQVHKPRRGSGFWIPLVALLIGINLSLVFVMWVMGERNTPVAPASQPAAETVAPAPQPAIAPQPKQAEPAEAAPPATVTAPPVAEPAATPDIYSANSAEEFGELPTIEELIMNNEISMAPIRIDIHVYSQVPSERFVFINMAKYTEGDTLEEGPKVVAINEQGVVLLHQGREFLVSREQ